MCGIAGIVDLTGGQVNEHLVRRMCDCLRHRGPDDDGFFFNHVVGLGQRRLSIIDLSTGHQPIGNEDGSVWVTYNGEIYNFQEIRRDLERAGHRFVTHSDTEVVVHAYEEDGPSCVERFRGMFAFALWDEQHKTLFLARDRVGKKPLYYAHVGGHFTFASELHALLQDPAISRDLDLTAIDDYLTYGYVPAPRTPFRDVYKLLPGHHLTLRADGGGAAAVTIQRYWELSYEPKLTLSEGEAAEGLLEHLREATRLRLIADVPLGALLSGGVDSSFIVALMSGLSDRPVKTFSIGFDEHAFDELPYAREVAHRFGTDHHELIVRPDALEVLPTLVRHYGEPLADSSAIPTYYVSKITREHVTVALNGDGGDESLAGYERYMGGVLADRYSRVPAAVRTGIVQPLVALLPDTPRLHRLRQAKGLLRAASMPPALRYMRWLTYFTPDEKNALYTPGFREHLNGHRAEAWLLDTFGEARANTSNALDTMLATDVHSYLPYDLLVKMDIASMANSLETRSPFLDHRVMEFCARLPARYKVRGTTLKYLLKQLGADVLPAETVRRRKMGFGPPLTRWMQNDFSGYLQDVLLSPEAGVRGYFDQAAIHQLVHDHISGTKDHAYQLWALLWLELWHQEMVRPPEPTLASPLPTVSTP